MELEPIDPETALELYLEEKSMSAAQATLDSHRSRLNHFVRWCDIRDIQNLNDLTGRRLQEFRLWRRNEGELSKVSVKTQIDTLRVFVRWLGTIDAVDPDLYQKVSSPDVTPDENSRDVKLEAADADSILNHLATYEYASRSHVIMALLWHSMFRIGGARAIDIEDYNPEEQSIEVKHRPKSGTPIKNQYDGERYVGLSGWVCQLLDDWIRERRPNVTDQHDRRPLIATRQGRASLSHLRTVVYRNTRPCVHSNECPHNRNPETCEAMEFDQAHKCPSSISPHAVRRGSITHHLAQDIPETAVSDRANVSKRVIDQHYDRRTKQEKMEQRRQYLEQL